MTSNESEIPLVGQVELADMPFVLTRPTVSGDRRIEDWIASNLDIEAEKTEGNHWNRLIANLPVFRRRPVPGRSEGATIPSRGGWSRFQVAYRRGFTIVRIVDQSLVQQSHIEELGQDLLDLIDVGNHRLILNFAAVERLGSWIIGVVASAHRRCAAADGGKLKLCGLDPQLAEIFSIVGMIREIDLQPDEAAAIDTPWPPRAQPRQLPVDILIALGALSELPPICGGAPDDSGEVVALSHGDSPFRSGDSQTGEEAIKQLTAKLHLKIKEGKTRAVAINSSRWLIGRDQTCQLRLGSAHVSKQHAAIEQRDGRVFLRDLKSTNGTMINGRLLRDLEMEVHHDDQIQIGPVLMSLVISSIEETPDHTDGFADQPTNVEAPDPFRNQADSPSTAELPFFEDLDPASRIKHELLEDVLVVTPQLPELDDDATLEALRSRLHSLLDQPLPRRVVVNLEFVNHLSRQAIALLLAHHVRLEWGGGALRICQAHARIIALLDQVRLTMLVDCFPTLDEAVLATWTGSCVPR
jgi:anti-anti-sigma factor